MRFKAQNSRVAVRYANKLVTNELLGVQRFYHTGEFMQHFKPKLILGILAPPQTELQDKFGGLPWGVPQERWPVCAKCGSPMTFLAQLQHHPERFDLGKEGRVLFVFMCNLDPGRCHTWEMDAGANAVLILDPAELSTGLTQPPSLLERDEMVEVEARVVKWIAGEDPVFVDQYSNFFKDEATYYDIPDEIRDEVKGGTKLGGVPSWHQGPQCPDKPYCFVAQFDHQHVFDGPVPSSERLGTVVTNFKSISFNVVQTAVPFLKRVMWPKRTVEMDVSDYEIQEPEQITNALGAPRGIIVSPKGTWLCDAANYGWGTAYLFVDADAASPSGKFLWQR